MTGTRPDFQKTPLMSGEVQFWRMAPENWAPALKTVKSLGIDCIATYLSWRRHAPEKGTTDLRGRQDRNLDVHRFLDLCAANDISVQLKPGPWICAEETGGGLPDWILADTDMMARDHAGKIVMGYNPPFKHPMPSYMSRRFRDAVVSWIGFVWSDLAAFMEPGGPIVATQLDNEPSLGFQDTMFGFDYHPDALAAFRSFVLMRHGSVRDLAAAWERPLARKDDIRPPYPEDLGGSGLHPSVRDLDWMDFQQHYIADYLGWLQQVNEQAGAGHLTSFVNLNTHPVRGRPQSGQLIGSTLRRNGKTAIVGEDHYFVPPFDARDLAGLALAAAQGMASGTSLVWAPEVQAGIWRSPGEKVDYPDPTDDELAGWWGASLALGYQGLNLYMLVNRENWAFAPVGEDGTPGRSAALVDALMKTVRAVPDLASYRPVADVALVWDPAILDAAYRVAGTQAAPLTPWDDPTATDAYRRLEAAAASLTARGLHFALVPAPRDDLFCVTGTTSDRDVIDIVPRVSAREPGMLCRLHRNPEGAELVHVVPWGTSVRQATLRFTGHTVTALREAASGRIFSCAPDGTIAVSLSSGLNLFHVVG